MSSLHLNSAVAKALREGQPVVALESALITHGLPYPANLETAQRIEAVVRQEGAVPASIAILEGEPHVGLSDDELRGLARLTDPQAASTKPPRKVSLRDLPIALAEETTGGTTVAATMHLARRAGIEVFATGGIGGVHRGRPEDVSADLTALGSIPVTVVCSGAKAILDLPRTREGLETRGVPVVGYGTDAFPAFYSPGSDLKVDVTLDTPEAVAHLVRARHKMGLSTALLICVPVPDHAALTTGAAEAAIAQAEKEADAARVTGKDLTPFLLGRIARLTDGKAQHANQALLVNNARVAARIARALTTAKSDA